MRRVVASSDSRSGNRSAIGGGCLPDVLTLRADFVGDFLADFLGDFLADLVDFLDDLERADFLAMNLFHVTESSKNLASALMTLRAPPQQSLYELAACLCRLQ